MFRAASMKLGLDYAVLHNLGGGSRSGLTGVSSDRAEHASALSKRELENLLKHGAYDMFHEGKEAADNPNVGEDSIDQILQRATVVVHQQEDKDKCSNTSTSSHGHGGSNSFSKVSFVVSKTEEDTEDVALDDPDFWTKIVGLAGGRNELEEVRGGKKRNCRNSLLSYKEGAVDNAADLMGNAKDVEGVEKSTKKRRRRGNDEEDEGGDYDGSLEGDREEGDEVEDPSVVNWTEPLMQRLGVSLVNCGYGNWAAIKAEAGLRAWPLKAVAEGCRVAVLQASSAFHSHQ